MARADTLGNPCEYGCAGPCESVEHWQRRADLLGLRAVAMHEDRDRWRQECWAIYLATGADPDGADPRHLNPGEALRAVEELREKCDLAYDAGHRDACNAAAEADRG